MKLSVYKYPGRAELFVKRDYAFLRLHSFNRLVIRIRSLAGFVRDDSRKFSSLGTFKSLTVVTVIFNGLANKFLRVTYPRK